MSEIKKELDIQIQNFEEAKKEIKILQEVVKVYQAHLEIKIEENSLLKHQLASIHD